MKCSVQVQQRDHVFLFIVQTRRRRHVIVIIHVSFHYLLNLNQIFCTLLDDRLQFMFENSADAWIFGIFAKEEKYFYGKPQVIKK